VPQHTLPILTSTPEDEQGFRDSIFASSAATWSDDVHADPRFAFELFHRFARRSGLIVPVHADRHAAGAFYLVWWERAERVDDTRIATLEAVGQQVALLLRRAWRLREAERQRADAIIAEQRYRGVGADERGRGARWRRGILGGDPRGHHGPATDRGSRATPGNLRAVAPHRKRASASTRYRASRPGAETGAKRALARLVLV
jgi:GAF domain-containing protein